MQPVAWPRTPDLSVFLISLDPLPLSHHETPIPSLSFFSPTPHAQSLTPYSLPGLRRKWVSEMCDGNGGTGGQTDEADEQI